MILEPSSSAPSPAALRMRRSRERRRQGDVIVCLEAGQSRTTALVALDWLADTDRGDKNALKLALAELIDRAIQLRVRPAMGSQGECRFMLKIPRNAIETLIEIGWLGADQRDDRAAIVNTFCNLPTGHLRLRVTSGPN